MHENFVWKKASHHITIHKHQKIEKQKTHKRNLFGCGPRVPAGRRGPGATGGRAVTQQLCRRQCRRAIAVSVSLPGGPRHGKRYRSPLPPGRGPVVPSARHDSCGRIVRSVIAPSCPSIIISTPTLRARRPSSPALLPSLSFLISSIQQKAKKKNFWL